MDRRLTEMENLVRAAYEKSEQVQNKNMYLIKEIKKSHDREKAFEELLRVGMQVLANKFGLNIDQWLNKLGPSQ